MNLFAVVVPTPAIDLGFVVFGCFLAVFAAKLLVVSDRAATKFVGTSTDL